MLLVQGIMQFERKLNVSSYFAYILQYFRAIFMYYVIPGHIVVFSIR